MKKTMYIILVMFALGTTSLSVTSCRENKTTSEKIEDAADDIGDGIEDAGDAIEDGVEDTGDAIEDAVD
ncbi:hypothetical protein [Formosa sp. S-31]|uniref:hypothetical protein n=1 Tax=Formosa sp. S-31 TaxID=2790949 RepID=UPI003EC0055C